MSSNMFLKIEGVTGESTADTNKNEIQVMSWSHSFNQPTKPTRSSAGGGTVEQANHSDFSFTKYLDASTDDLLKLCWSGKTTKDAVFSAYRANGDNSPIKYLEVTMSEVVVSNVSIGGGGGDLPNETVTLSYGKVEYKYIPQKPTDGTADSPQPVSHDLVAQKVG